MEYDSYTFSVNGTHNFNVEEAAELGTYNMLMPDTPFYDMKNQTFASSHSLFRNAFGGSFPWEVLEVISGTLFYILDFRE